MARSLRPCRALLYLNTPSAVQFTSGWLSARRARHVTKVATKKSGELAATRSVRTRSNMPSRVYLPADFWGVAFTTKGSALPKIMLRSIVFTAPAILAVLVRRDGYLGDGIGPTDEDSLTRFTLPEVPGRLITPFALLVALLTSYRLNHAHGKWEVANGSVMVIQETSRLLISRLCAIFPATAINKERLLRFRRLMVLACVSIYKHVHSIKDFDAELQRNLLTREEVALFSRISTISYEEGHNKSDKFPTKNRRAPALTSTRTLTTDPNPD